jgi:hypothetical protein
LDRFEKYQAEALIHKRVPLDALVEVGGPAAALSDVGSGWVFPPWSVEETPPLLWITIQLWTGGAR